MKRLEVTAAALLTALAGYVLWVSESLRAGSFRVPQTGFFPRMLGGLLLLLTIGELARALRQGGGASEVERIPIEGWRRIGAALAIMLLFALMLERLGFLLATFVLMILLLRAIEAPPWRKVMIVALLTSVLSYGLFAWLLGVPLPAGILGI